MKIVTQHRGTIRNSASLEAFSRYARLLPMEQPAGWQRWLEVLGDYVHGASVLIATLLTIAQEATDIREPEALLAELADEVRKAHPGIPALLRTVLLLQEELSESGSLPAAALDLTARIKADRGQVVARAAQLIARRPHVMSISYSGMARDSLLAAAKAHAKVHFFVGEGRPRGEGLLLAQELASEGVVCTVYADLAFAQFLPQAQLVLVGADAVFSESFINKTGTDLLLREARSAGIPTALIYDFTKRVDDELRPSELPSPSASEITGESESKLPPGLTVANSHFEEIPLALIDQDLHGGK